MTLPIMLEPDDLEYMAAEDMGRDLADCLGRSALGGFGFTLTSGVGFYTTTLFDSSAPDKVTVSWFGYSTRQVLTATLEYLQAHPRLA